MRVTIFGSGYVGLVTGACLADAGNDVVCVDVDAAKIARLNAGEIPIHEPGLEELVARNRDKGRLKFTTDAKSAIEHGLFQVIAVGTPPGRRRRRRSSHVISVARTIGEHIREYKIVMTKSTVPVGTSDTVKATIAATLKARGAAVEFDVVSNPEFLKEGAAVADFMKPDRIVVGTDNPRTAELLKALYDPFTRNHQRMIVMDLRSAELTKYAANAMLATKISFMNEMANIAERLGADIEMVRAGIGSDPRIGYAFIYPGAGYGGSCFPKDVKALKRSASDVGHDAPVLAAVESVNDRQKKMLFDKLSRFFERQSRRAHHRDLGPGVQAEHGRPARSTEPRADGGIVESGRPRSRLRPRRHAGSEAHLWDARGPRVVRVGLRPPSKARTHSRSAPNGRNSAARTSPHSSRCSSSRWSSMAAICMTRR